MKRITINTLNKHKQNNAKFAVITAYDSSFAALVDTAEIDVILVGDSLGMVLQGQDSTLPVSVEDMAYHTQCVSRGSKRALIIADMPFASYGDPVQALENAAELMKSGAQMIKMEGGQWLTESITQMVQQGIPVCAHLGLTPQSVNTLGGYRVQGRTQEQAQQIIDDAKALEKAGASLLVVECVPTALGKRLTESLTIPVIGIGAGVHTDAQVLVLHDMLGVNEQAPSFVKNFMDGQNSIKSALIAYNQAVINATFPDENTSFD